MRPPKRTQPNSKQDKKDGWGEAGKPYTYGEYLRDKNKEKE